MIPRHVIDGLKCGLCNSGLSIFPIHSYGNNAMVTCGRCPVQRDFLPQREHLYEELAKYIEFSCRYENLGCIEKLNPDELEKHERVCPQKPCLCPILPLGNCKWQGDYKDLFAHCTDVHPDFSQESFSTEINLVTSNETNYVFSQASEIFVAQLKADSTNHRFYVNVRYCGAGSNAKIFSYRVCFVGKKKKFGCSVHAVQLGEIGPILTETATMTDFMDILENLNYPLCVVCRIDIFVKKTTSEKPETDEAVVNQGIDLLRKLECPVCLEYMIPPIMQCNGGHSFCQTCRNQITTCPICKGTISDTRNFLLEDITSMIVYPCKFKKYGCKFSAKADQIQQHQNNCIDGPYRCIMDDCNWVDRHTKFLDHLSDTHKDNIVETDSVSYILDNTLDMEFYNYICIVNGKVFRIEFSRDGDEFWWFIHTTKENTDVDKYILILDFKCGSDERLYIKKKISEHSLLFQKEQLCKFIDGDVLTYKMQIVEST